MPPTHSPLAKIVVLDPGGTTGFAVFSYGRLVQWGSFETFTNLESLIQTDVSLVICEEVHARSAAFNDIGIRVSGVIEFLCWKEKIKFFLQKPTILPGMFRLVPFEGFPEIDDHAKDAILHGAYFLSSTHTLSLPTSAKSLTVP